MKIIDLNGLFINVNNLQLAIMQADDYRHLQCFNPEHVAFAEKQRQYWEDIYQKLLYLQTAEIP
jgi:hypothetical protein